MLMQRSARAFFIDIRIPPGILDAFWGELSIFWRHIGIFPYYSTPLNFHVNKTTPGAKLGVGDERIRN